MKLFDGAWMFPDGETHLPEWMTREQERREGRLCYQLNKYAAALSFCEDRRVAVDIGAHVGLWSYWMARDFEALHAFEPDADHGACWALNLQGRPSATLHRVALGASPGCVELEHPSACSSGNTRIIRQALAPTVPMSTLDSYALADVDFVKLDCEGYEYFALLGAIETICRCRPVVIVEQKAGCGPHYGRGEQDAVTLLTSVGASQRANLGGDFLMTFEDA